MASRKIELKQLKAAVNAVFHLIEDLGIETIAIEGREDFYWIVSEEDVPGSKRA